MNSTNHDLNREMRRTNRLHRVKIGFIPYKWALMPENVALREKIQKNAELCLLWGAKIISP